MDSALAHMVSTDMERDKHGLKVRCISHMIAVYLSVSTTPVVQPSDQGIIWSLKVVYHRSQV